MKQKNSSITIRPFTNPSGALVYQVDGTIAGKRIRKNFPSRKEALAEKSALELQALQACDASVRMVTTYLSPDELRESEAVFRLFKESKDAAKSGKTLSFYVAYALANYRAPECDMPLATATEAYKAQRIEDHALGLISDSQLVNIKRYMKNLTKHFPNALVTDLTPEKLKDYCAHGKVGPSGHGKVGLKTHNNRRGIISTFLKFATDKGWALTNPMAKVAHYRIAHKRGTAPTLSAEQSAALMAYVEEFQGGRLVPFFALCLFAGIRPCVRTGEILRLDPKSVNMETGVIHIEPDVSKVDMKRNVTIQPNLAAWLRAYPLDKFPIIVPNHQHLRAAIAKKFAFKHDVMRHTFISMHVAKFRSMGDAALQAGNSEAIIRRHYLDVKSSAEAEAFFAILPKKAADANASAPTPAVAADCATGTRAPDETRQLAA